MGNPYRTIWREGHHADTDAQPTNSARDRLDRVRGMAITLAAAASSTTSIGTSTWWCEPWTSRHSRPGEQPQRESEPPGPAAPSRAGHPPREGAGSSPAAAGAGVVL